MGGLSLMHWLVLGVVGIVFFGPKRLPQLGSSLGESIRGFKKALNEDEETTQEDPVKHARIVQEKEPTDRS